MSSMYMMFVCNIQRKLGQIFVTVSTIRVYVYRKQMYCPDKESMITNEISISCRLDYIVLTTFILP